MEKIHSDLIGIGKLLKQSRFIVPAHQRPYAWEEEHINDLFRDIYDAKNRKKDEEYFLGTVVLAASGDGRESIIDGQQRLVTTSILIAAIRDYFANNKQSQRAQDITQEYLSKRDIRTQEETAYLHLVPEDREFFQKRVVLMPSDTSRHIDPVSQAQQRLANAIDLAYKFIGGIANSTQNPDDVLLDLLEYIDKQSLLISVKVGDEANAFIIFEVLNDRGLDLSIADLIKNYIFRLAGDRLAEAQVAWSRMTMAIMEIADEPDVKIFIRQAWISINGLTREKQLYDAIKKQINVKAKSVEYANHLAKQAATYAALNNQSHELWKNYNDSVSGGLEVFDMAGVTQIRPLLLAIFDRFSEIEVNKTIPMMVAWTVRFLICGSGGSGTLETHYSDRAKEVSNSTIKTASQLYHAMKSVLPVDQVFHDAFAVTKVSKSTIAKYYLRTLEQQQQLPHNDSEMVVNTDIEKVNLEHILPQTYNAATWGHISQDEHGVLVRRLGNLALLNSRMNSKASNSDFKTKTKILAMSNFELTKDIAGQDTWSVSEINTRQEKLAKLALKAWPNSPRP